MSKAITIIKTIRDTLGDPAGDRWTNDRLLRSINSAIKDINKKAKILRAKGTFQLQAGTSVYKLDDEVQLITRALYKGKPIEFKSHAEMDELSDTWETKTGDILECLVYDKLNRGQVRTYPVISDGTNYINSVFGVITSVENYNLNSPFGVMVSLDAPLDEIVIFYIKKPNSIFGLNDEIELDDEWDKAIKHFVCGETLRDDKDTQNRAFGNEELNLYQIELQEAKLTASKNYQVGDSYVSNYRSL